MKRHSAALAAVALFLLGACSREHGTLTGAYGSAVVTGEVVMGEGVSPAGVEVSVSGTGMRSSCPDGRFAFAVVQEDAVGCKRAAENRRHGLYPPPVM